MAGGVLVEERVPEEDAALRDGRVRSGTRATSPRRRAPSSVPMSLGEDVLLAGGGGGLDDAPAS